MNRNTRLLLTLGPGLRYDSHGDVVVFDWREDRVVDRRQHLLTAYDSSHKGLAGACWNGRRLLVAAEAELLELDVAPLRLVSSQTFPFLNDAHHIAFGGDRFWVCNSGLDCIEELDDRWRHVRVHDLIRPFGRRWKEVALLLRHDLKKSLNRIIGRIPYYHHLDKRPPFRNLVKLFRPDHFRGLREDLRNFDFRPHLLHPNHLFVAGDDVWITLWQTGEIVSLRGKRILADGLGRPHDGIPAGDEFYITDCLSNRVVVHAFDPGGPTLGAKLRETIVTQSTMDGFLRGLAVVGDRVYIGLSARRGAKDCYGAARIVCLDRRSLRRIDQRIIPTQYGRAVFSVHDASKQYANFEAPMTANPEPASQGISK